MSIKPLISQIVQMLIDLFELLINFVCLLFLIIKKRIKNILIKYFNLKVHKKEKKY